MIHIFSLDYTTHLFDSAPPPPHPPTYALRSNPGRFTSIRRHRATRESSSRIDSRPHPHVCRMSSTQRNKNQEESKTETGGNSEVRPAVNPFVAAAVGAVFLASDPSVSLATQSIRDALLSEQQSFGVKGGVFLAASEVKANTDLKGLLGEV